MADVVQFRLERMVDELDDLERRGLFTRREIAEIVKKRRTFEYRLKRPSPLKQDFLAYIDYEKQLDSLRNLRKKSIIREIKKTDRTKKWKKSVSDISSVRRILDVYRLAVFRYKGDLGLWFQYLEFCRERRHGRMKQALAQAIRYHPKVPGLWIYAAAWEFDQNLNVTAARALMQSGLRACGDSEDLWVEYLRMELTYLKKLKARKVALGEDIGRRGSEHNDESDKEWKEENKDFFMPLNGNVDEKDGLDHEEEEEEEKKADALLDRGLKVFRTIYDGAVDALPLSMNLRKRFLEVIEETDLIQSDELKEEIINDIKRNFSAKEEFWDWLGRLQVLGFKQRRETSRAVLTDLASKAAQVYEEALNAIPTSKMFSLYARFLLDLIPSQNNDSQLSWISGMLDNVVDLTADLLNVYEKAECKGCLTEDLAYECITTNLQLGRTEDARHLAERFCSGQLSRAVKLWTLRISIEMTWVTRDFVISKDDLTNIFELLRSVLTRVAVAEAESLWLMAIKFFSSKKTYFNKLVELILTSLAKGREADDGFSVASAFVNGVLARDGVQQARDLYKRFLALPHPSLALYRHCIELESNLAHTGSTEGLVNARKLYESALSYHSQNVKLWQDYYSLELKVGTPETATAVHWRARKMLKDRVALVAHEHL